MKINNEKEELFAIPYNGDQPSTNRENHRNFHTYGR